VPDSPLPLYHKVYLLLKQRLEAGGFATDRAMPGENALAAEYGVSRLTIRRSLDALAADGLIERRQGRGTFAAAPAQFPGPQHGAGIDALMAHLARMGMHTQVRLLELETAPATPPVAARLELPTGAPVQRAVRVRSHEGQPFSHRTTSASASAARTWTPSRSWPSSATWTCAWHGPNNQFPPCWPNPALPNCWRCRWARPC